MMVGNETTNHSTWFNRGLGVSKIYNKQRNSVEFIFASLISIALFFFSFWRGNCMQNRVSEYCWHGASKYFWCPTFIEHGRDFSIFIFPLFLNCYMLTRNSSASTFRIVLWWISTRLITKWNEKQTQKNIVNWEGTLFAMKFENFFWTIVNILLDFILFYYFYVFLNIY